MDTLNNMRVFVSVVDYGTFTAAAAAMRVTTASVSRAISDLEANVRSPLLHRTTRRVALTAAGERYLPRVRQILADVEDAQAEVLDADIHASGTLRIHAMTSFAQHYLIPAIAGFRRLHPDVAVDLTLSQRVPDLLDEGCDVALLLAETPVGTGLVGRGLGTVASVACAAPAYLARAGTPKTPEALLDHPCLQLLSPVFPLDEWVFEPTEGGAPVRIRVPAAPFTVNVAEAMRAAIEAGMGVGLLPVYAALAGLRGGTLVRVLPGYQLPALPVQLVYPSRRDGDAKIRAWEQYLSRTLPAAMAADSAEALDLTSVAA
ncbi:LysR family transcriptional regulator [Chitinasiproducens palmae]|uniref:DNA-binding transcriptional regulator, LysR family n=1 Tax=Chitinasiproducens palmae TaxID=1770053 RepID=A0A1H2PW68_9BURK|nr:LysR family transcriptional regulator [Chitinasiproducens palmae]SDV51581.1 DNA-binding transcriptional regulator, LysR family [Chitinasiproducens palmae]